jgi:hypothetical protein
MQGGLLLCVYSIPGGGKTILGAGLMQALWKAFSETSLLADWDNGSYSIPQEVQYELWKPGPGNPYDEMLDMFECATRMPIKLLVIDTMSSLGMSLLTMATESKIQGDKEGKLTITTPQNAQINIPTRTHHYAALRAFEKICMLTLRLQEQDKHVLWLCHERAVEQREGKGVTTEPYGGPEIVGARSTAFAPKWPAVVARIKLSPALQGGNTRTLQVSTDGIFIARDRLRIYNPKGLSLDASSGNSPEQFNRNLMERAEAAWDPVIKFLKDRKAGRSSNA